eukprot:3799439-Pleurochrysis_carterae.AAC.1
MTEPMPGFFAFKQPGKDAPACLVYWGAQISIGEHAACHVLLVAHIIDSQCWRLPLVVSESLRKALSHDLLQMALRNKGSHSDRHVQLTFQRSGFPTKLPPIHMSTLAEKRGRTRAHG